MRLLVALACVAGVAVAPIGAWAEKQPDFDPDFHFILLNCRISGATLAEPPTKNDGFSEMKTSGYHTACERTAKKKLSCITVFEEENAKPAFYDMTITTEASKLLIVESQNAGDFIVARPDTGRVVATTRMLGEEYVATKLCHGVFLTGDEYKAMEAKQKRKTGK